jgi:CheY-like chemotaxis protein
MGLAGYILVVEDCRDTRESLRLVLEASGYAVACAGNGQEAIDVLRYAGSPCVILLDLAMPVMDGRRFHEWLRVSPEFRKVPVILHSGEANLPQIAAWLGAAYVAKPAELGQLFDTIRRLERQPAAVG